MTLNKFSASRAERLEVGSSMMSTRALVESALAISTSCCWPMASVLTSVSGFTSSPTASMCHRVMVMQNGKIVEQGPVAEVLVNPQTDYTKRLVRAAFEIAT